MRKYFTEVGINSYIHEKLLIPVESLDEVDDDNKYHIYMILSIPKIIINKDSLICNENGISCDLTVIKDGNEELIKIRNYKPFTDINFAQLDISTSYPYTSLYLQYKEHEIEILYKSITKDNKYPEITLEDFREKLLSSPVEISSDYIYNYSLLISHNYLDMNVLYIGQAYGSDGERTATKRLKSHSTLQKILMDCHTKSPDKRLYLLLLEFTDNLQMYFDGMSQNYIKSNEEDNIHIHNVLSNIPNYKQVINITEAALINYFKPSYNINFVENFPNHNHLGYKQYFNLDYNSLIVELDLAFNNHIQVKLYTDYAEAFGSFNFISYDLFNDENRDSMYSIFKKK
ncbi:MAG: hypothetical protein KIB00_16830 [Paeniclostridium sordellii]|nr:hypothetical protein [Paeniclostridium sordellii]